MIAQLTAVVERIEQLVAEPGASVDVPALAREVATTEHHLRRMFSALTGMPISEYVRRRWMTRAADDLVAGDDDLLSVAVRHGYSSTESFGRAFRAVHGARPTDVRRAGGPVRAQLPLRFHLTVEGSTPMDVRVLDLPAFRLIGPSARVPLVHAGANPHIAAFLRGLPPGTTDALAAFAAASADPATRPSGVVAVSDGLDPDRAEGTELTYQHAVAVPAGATPAVPGLPEGVAVATTEVAAGTWAVFASSGPFPAALQDTWARTATEWFPSQPYRLRPGPELLTVTVHPPAAGTPATSGPTADAEIWLPVAR